MPPVIARLVLVALAVVGGAGRAGHRDAGELLAQDDVDHAGHRVGAVDGGRAVLQDLDALDRVERDLLAGRRTRRGRRRRGRSSPCGGR